MRLENCTHSVTPRLTRLNRTPPHLLDCQAAPEQVDLEQDCHGSGATEFYKM